MHLLSISVPSELSLNPLHAGKLRGKSRGERLVDFMEIQPVTVADDCQKSLVHVSASALKQFPNLAVMLPWNFLFHLLVLYQFLRCIYKRLNSTMPRSFILSERLPSFTVAQYSSRCHFE